MTVDPVRAGNWLDRCLGSPTGLLLLGVANLVLPFLGFCIQWDGTTGCPGEPSRDETAWWLLLSGFLLLGSLAMEDSRWRGGS